MASPTYIAIVPYADRTFANAYFADRLDTEEWDDANDATKDKALKNATQFIDTLYFIGRRSDPDQAREFPRESETDIPYEVAQGCTEVSLALLRGNDAERIHAQGGKDSESIGDASVSYSDENGGVALLANNFNIVSNIAMRYLSEWLMDPREMELHRTS